MRLLRLRLFDYRNIHRLDFSPGPGASALVGACMPLADALEEVVALGEDALQAGTGGDVVAVHLR